MIALGTDEASWAAGISARLRVVQSSFADDPAATREAYLRDELERALRELPSARRKPCLEALAERFPFQGLNGGAQSEQAADRTATEAVESPALLVARLVERAGALSLDERQALARELVDGGFALELRPASMNPTPPPVDAIPPELEKKLGIHPDQSLDHQRVLRLIGVLIDLTVSLDQVAWTLWKGLAPNSAIRRDAGADVRKIAGPYLLGDPEVSTANLTHALDRTRQLIGGLLAAVGASGEAFARGYLARFSPEAIKEQADAEPGFFIGPEQKCWRKYIDLFNASSGVAIEHEITNAIVRYAEEVMLGTGARK
jgi:hypothetical protein